MSDIPDPGAALTADGGWARNVEELIACAALVVVVVATSWGVFTRYVSAQPSTWAPEIAAAAFCWVIFLGAAAVFKRSAHVSVDIAVMKLPVSARRALMIVVDLLVLGFLAWISWLAIAFTIESWDTPMPSLRWPYSFHYAGAALGLLAMTLRHGQSALRRHRAEG